MTLIQLLPNYISLRRPKTLIEVEICSAYYSIPEDLANPDAVNDSSSFPLIILKLYPAYLYEKVVIQFVLSKVATKIHEGSIQAPLSRREPIYMSLGIAAPVMMKKM